MSPEFGVQERIVDGPDENKVGDDEFDLDENHFPNAENEAPTRKKIELALGLGFLVIVLLIALWRRNRV